MKIYSFNNFKNEWELEQDIILDLSSGPHTYWNDDMLATWFNTYFGFTPNVGIANDYMYNISEIKFNYDGNDMAIITDDQSRIFMYHYNAHPSNFYNRTEKNPSDRGWHITPYYETGLDDWDDSRYFTYQTVLFNGMFQYGSRRNNFQREYMPTYRNGNTSDLTSDLNPNHKNVVGWHYRYDKNKNAKFAIAFNVDAPMEHNYTTYSLKSPVKIVSTGDTSMMQESSYYSEKYHDYNVTMYDAAYNGFFIHEIGRNGVSDFYIMEEEIDPVIGSPTNKGGYTTNQKQNIFNKGGQHIPHIPYADAYRENYPYLSGNSKRLAIKYKHTETNKFEIIILENSNISQIWDFSFPESPQPNYTGLRYSFVPNVIGILDADHHPNRNIEISLKRGVNYNITHFYSKNVDHVTCDIALNYLGNIIAYFDNNKLKIAKYCNENWIDTTIDDNLSEQDISNGLVFGNNIVMNSYGNTILCNTPDSNGVPNISMFKYLPENHLKIYDNIRNVDVYSNFNMILTYGSVTRIASFDISTFTIDDFIFKLKYDLGENIEFYSATYDEPAFVKFININQNKMLQNVPFTIFSESFILSYIMSH